MKLIVKDREPREWVEVRNTPGTDYEAIPALRESLYKEQGGICAYCMGRLNPEPSEDAHTRNKVEHIKPRESCNRDERMDYNNLVLCCHGTIAGTAPESTHCDTHKGSSIISFTPMNPVFIDTLSYNYSGEIKSSNSLWNNEISNVLNLNQKQLSSNRKAVIMKVVEWLKKNPTKGEIERRIDFYNTRHCGLYEEYCEVAIWRLKKSLKSR